ncbi:MAG: AbrB/MazE/SpoVT family DNA-binding domain-containing protein [Anaerolineales bacterium]|nr:MAG: AbrB/MazE/SpoVT family DNA-binding domain-containing protein [Anaerolineales bacterium]
MELTISKNGTIRIPADLRKKYRITQGVKIMFMDHDGSLVIVPLIEESIKIVRNSLTNQATK